MYTFENVTTKVFFLGCVWPLAIVAKKLFTNLSSCEVNLKNAGSMSRLVKSQLGQKYKI